MPRGRHSEPIEKRFWTKVEKSEAPDGCWNWVGCLRSDGYGEIAKGPKRSDGALRAHRVSWELANGPIPEGKQVLHKCIANRACVNPAHLYVGKPKDNRDDCVEQDRHVYGTRHPLAKLDEAAILDIKDRYHRGVSTLRDLYREYGVSEAAVRKVITGKSWKHVSAVDPVVLTPLQKAEIWAFRRQGVSQAYLAQRYGVSKRAIKTILLEQE